MKHIILAIPAVLLLSACVRNFNPETDSTLCPMSFTFDTDHLFDNILTCTDGHFILGDSKTLPEGYLLRIRSFCYDSAGQFVRTDEVRVPGLSETKLEVPYVFSTESYRFIFFADLVREDNSYWYSLSSSYLQSAYMRRGNDETAPLKSKSVWSGEWSGTPVSSTVRIDLYQASYNCWCVLRNLTDIDKIEVGFSYYDTFYFRNYFIGKQRYFKTTTYYPPLDSLCIPLVLTMADESLYVKICNKHYSQRDTLVKTISNDLRRSFVLKVDGSTLENSIDWYE